MLFNKYRYIVVEGPIGVGKTSLTRLLAERFSANQLLENPGANPFLADFYQDTRRYALATQLFFLFQRIDQMRQLVQLDMFQQVTFADFIIEKDPLFAHLNLNEDEFSLYQEIYNRLKPSTVTPDLVIYLQGSIETLIERVTQRGIDYERQISAEYLSRLAETYSRFFYQYNASPLLIVNSDNLNFVAEPAHFDLLLERIDNLRGPREFFSLGGN